MLDVLVQGFGGLMQRGGVVMWVLLVLSVIAVTLLLERAWFFVRTNSAVTRKRVGEAGARLRSGQLDAARAAVSGDGGVYAEVVRQLLDEPATDAAIADAIEAQRRRLERFMPTLSTVITAAPMLGILGTVLGIIESFDLLSSQDTGNDPRLIGAGIAEALLTTAAGLVVALVTLFPYNGLRAQIDRTLGRLESLAASVQQGRSSEREGQTRSE